MDQGRPPDPEPADTADAEPVVDGPGEPVEGEVGVVPTEEVPLEPRGPSRVVAAIAIVVIAAMVVFAILGGRILSAPDADPLTRPEPRLAVTDGDGRLLTMRPDGTHLREYAADEDLEFGFPAWSPDGTRIAVTGNDNDGTRLYLFDAAATADAPGNSTAQGSTADEAAEPTVLYEEPGHPPFYLYWTPDGRQIGFLTSEREDIALRLVPADGSAAATVVRQGSPLYWDWLGNDHLVAHIGSSGSSAFLGEVDLAGETTEAGELEPGYFRSPAVSRDGSFRAYVTSGQDSTGIVTLESSDRSVQHTAPVFGVAAVSFDPTGGTLAYVASEHRAADELAFPLGPLKLLDPGRGEPRTLLPGEVVAFFWSPDGTTIAALTLPPDDEEIVGVPGARLASARGAPPGTNAEPPLNQGVPLILVFVDVATGAIESSRRVDVTSRYVNTLLPYYDQYALSHRTWSPDSTAIALPLDVNGDDRLYVIPADGSEATQLGEAELGFWSP